MSGEVKITSVEKVKDPKRVEAGKRLGAISKQAKERRARERSERSEQSEHSERNLSADEPGGLSMVVGVAGVIVGVVGIYYACRGPPPKTSSAPEDTKDIPREEAKQTSLRSKLDSFD